MHCRTTLPEYEVELRKLKCTVSGYPLPTKMYKLFHMNAQSQELPKERPRCEMVSPTQFAKDVKQLSANLRSMHVYIPPTAFLRQVIVRPAKDTDDPDIVLNAKPSTYKLDPELETEAEALRKEIEVRFRKQYAEVLDSQSTGVNLDMPHKHVIEPLPEAEPYNKKLRRLSPLEVDLLGAYVKEMVEAGRIQPSVSPWGANVLFVPKPDGSFRCVQDYRELNSRMRHDTYPLPRIDVQMDLAQGRFWTKIDLLKGFYQLPMCPDSAKYTAFNTIYGKYEFLVMPMGLQNAPGSFMRAMNKILDGLLWDPNLKQSAGVLVYLDDILIFSQTAEEHLQILEQVLQRLQHHSLQCRFDKCSFAKTEIEYLGFMLSAQGIRMDPKKIQIIKDWPEQPKSKTDIRAFLGLANYLKRFCPNLSHHTAILSDWASESSKANWTDKHKASMNVIKGCCVGMRF